MTPFARLAALLVATTAGCGPRPCGYHPGDPNEVTASGGTIHRYVINRLLVPLQRSDYAIDLNGDARVDNQLGIVIGGFAGGTGWLSSVPVQPGVDDAVAAGVAPLLIAVQTSSADDDSHTGVTLQNGRANPMPDYTSGMGAFVVDGSKPPFAFLGRTRGGRFSSNDPVLTSKPVQSTLVLPLLGSPPVSLSLDGAHIQFNSQKPGLVTGEIHATITSASARSQVVPALARWLTDQIHTACESGTCMLNAMQLLSIFDTGGCTDADGKMALQDDRVLATCELATNAIIVNMLASDVEIHDSAGTYAPNSCNGAKDSFSLGLGFTAVAAQF